MFSWFISSKNVILIISLLCGCDIIVIVVVLDSATLLAEQCCRVHFLPVTYKLYKYNKITQNVMYDKKYVLHMYDNSEAFSGKILLYKSWLSKIHYAYVKHFE